MSEPHKRRSTRRRASEEAREDEGVPVEIPDEGGSAAVEEAPQAPADTVSVGTTPVPVPTVKARRPAPAPRRATGATRKLRIRNNSGQLVTCSVLSEDGRALPVKLRARAISEPFPEAHITDYTRSMVARGTLSLVR